MEYSYHRDEDCFMGVLENITVSLPEEMLADIRAAEGAGEYPNTSEAVRDALRHGVDRVPSCPATTRRCNGWSLRDKVVASRWTVRNCSIVSVPSIRPCPLNDLGKRVLHGARRLDDLY